METLLAQVVRALADPGARTTEALDALNRQTGRDHCNRRARILHQLQSFVHQNQPAMPAPSTTHRFKKDFNKQKANIEIDGQTKAVSAENLTNEDVPLLQQYGYGHFIEALPEPEKQEEAEDLHKLLKPALQARYKEATGTEADDKLTKEELIKAIEAAETTK